MSAQPGYRHDHHDARLEQLRVPPHSIEAEQAVLGGLMLAPEAFDRVNDKITDADFYRRDHQLIYRAISELAEKNKPFDAVTLGEWFEAQGQIEQVSGGAYLVELASTTPSAANVRAYAEIVKDKSKLRNLIEVGTGIINSGFDPEGREADEVIAEASGAVIQLASDKTTGGAKSMKEVAKDWFDGLQDRFANTVANVVLTPWSTLNKITCGLEPGHLVIVAGRPSMGKSAFAVNLSTSCAMRDEPKPVHYIDLESTNRAIYNRALASTAMIPLRWLRNPAGEEGDYWANVTVGMRDINQSAMRIDDTPGLSIQRIIARARSAHRKEEFKVLVIDHLHLIPLPGKTRETVEIGHITAALKQLAKELNIVVVLLAQLNRSLESRADKRPTMADLRESGNIEQDADVIMLLYRDDYYAERESRASKAPGLLEIFVAKQREGEVGSAYAKTNLAYGLLDDISSDEVKTILSTGASSDTDDFGDKKPVRRLGGGQRKQAAVAA